MRLALLLLAVGIPAFPQKLLWGVKAGVPLTDLVSSQAWKNGRYYPSSGRYTLGPTLELTLPFRLSIEFDLLYRSAKYRFVNTVSGAAAEASGNAFQFPLLLKLRLSRRFVAPYMAGGVTFNRLTGLKQLGELDKATVSGFVAGAGLEGRLPLVRISPEIRYTRWGSANLRNLTGNFSLSSQNQIEALVGITF